MYKAVFKNLVDMLETRANNNPNLPIYTFLNENPQDQEQMTLLELSTHAKSIAYALEEQPTQVIESSSFTHLVLI